MQHICYDDLAAVQDIVVKRNNNPKVNNLFHSLISFEFLKNMSQFLPLTKVNKDGDNHFLN